MNMILMVLLMIAMFHLFIYYWNLDFNTKPIEVTVDLSDTRAEMEKHLNELKQFDLNSKHG
jgi:hypothetical protein